jgi:hypothetical protein
MTYVYPSLSVDANEQADQRHLLAASLARNPLLHDQPLSILEYIDLLNCTKAMMALMDPNTISVSEA